MGVAVLRCGEQVGPALQVGVAGREEHMMECPRTVGRWQEAVVAAA